MTLRQQQTIIRHRRKAAWVVLCLMGLGLGSITAWTLNRTLGLLQQGEQGVMLAAMDQPNSDERLIPTHQIRVFQEPPLATPRLEADWLEEASIPTELVAPHHVDPKPVIVDSPKPATAEPQPASPTFDGRPIRPARTIRMLVTAYSPDERSCGKWADGITASGSSVWTNGMKLVAADTRLLPFGSIVSVPGYNDGRPVPVLDRGGAIKGRRLDVLYPTHEIALRWGSQWLDVTVWEYAD